MVSRIVRQMPQRTQQNNSGKICATHKKLNGRGKVETFQVTDKRSNIPA